MKTLDDEESLDCNLSARVAWVHVYRVHEVVLPSNPCFCCLSSCLYNSEKNLRVLYMCERVTNGCYEVEGAIFLDFPLCVESWMSMAEMMVVWRTRGEKSSNW